MQAHGQEKRSHLILITVLLLSGAVVGAAAASQPVSEPNDLRWDLAEGFAFAWDSVELSAKSLNPAQNAEADSGVSERTLTICGTLDILDADDLVAMHIEDPVVFAVRDADGNDVALEPVAPGMVRQYEEVLRSIGLKIKVLSFAVSIHVHPAFDQVLPSELSSLQGYVHAMYAEDAIEVKVPLVQTAVEWVNAPFCDPLVGWITVAPGLQIRVVDAYTAGDFYEYYTEVRSLTGPVTPLAVLSDSGVGDYVVVRTVLAGALGYAFCEQSISNSLYTRDAVGCLGTWSLKRCQGKYDKVLHVVAVHPREVKIPFELKNIPVPSVEPVAE